MTKRQAQNNHGKPRWRESGWKVGALAAACTAALVLFTNIGVTIWVLKSVGFSKGLATVFTGDCQSVRKFNTWIHLAINILSTVLVSGSNYCMQCLSAPTRREVNSAHEKKRWLDIGVPSVRNLRSISQKRVLLWWCLAVSSVPLHLMYNSAFFSALSTNNYNVFYARESFAAGGSYNISPWSDNIWPSTDYVMRTTGDVQTQASTFERLENKACIQAYANDLITTRRHVILVVDNTVPKHNSSLPDGIIYYSTSENSSLLQVYQYEFPKPTGDSNYLPYDWICDHRRPYFNNDTNAPHFYSIAWEGCNEQIPKLLNLADEWDSGGYRVDYCLSQRIKGSCSLNFSGTIICIVIIFNLGKLIVMAVVVFGVRDTPLITVGDAVDSFLLEKDPTTEGICLATRDIIGNKGWISAAEPMEYRPESERWFHAAGKTRWWVCIILFGLMLCSVLGLMVYGIMHVQAKHDIKTLWSLGIGAVHPQSIIFGWSLPSSGGSSLIASVLVANTPQLLFSILYLIFNGLCTSMLLAKEWSHFISKRKPLRVSNPKQGQRSTYFLQLPYRFALPLMVISGILHWLVSQSIFLANVSIIDPTGNVDENNVNAFSTCGYSPIAMIFVLVCGVCLISTGIALGFRHFEPGMPLVGSCSAAISAACHGPPGEVDATLHPVQWGALPRFENSEVGHCCFSSGDVERPRRGQLYAGVVLQQGVHEGVNASIAVSTTIDTSR